MDIASKILESIVNLFILFFESIGVIVIIIAGLKGLVSLIIRKANSTINMAKGMSIGLEFKLGGEILRTVVLRELSEIVVVAGIIALRTALAFFIHWRIKHEEDITES